MRIDDPQITEQRIREFAEAGYWTSTTSNEELERVVAATPDKAAIADGRVRLTYAEYHQRIVKLAEYFVGLGLTKDDVIAVQLPNWSEFAVAVNAAMLAGIPFCQYHSDFRSREVKFILGFTEASTLILPTEHRGFDYLDMISGIRSELPGLRNILAVGDEVPGSVMDLRGFLDETAGKPQTSPEVEARRPHGNDLARTAFTSGTTGDPKAVLHLHNTTNCAIRFLNRGQAIGPESVFLVFLPVGLNWGLFNTLQSMFAGCTMIYQSVFKPGEALDLIQRERVTHFCCAPAHLVSMLNEQTFDQYDLSSLEVIMTGGASCPIEVIRDVRNRFQGHLLEMYGMLECGTQAHTLLTDDPEEVCGTVGKPVPEMGIRVVDESDNECKSGEVGEILTYGPSVTVGYYNNPEANAKSFVGDGWFRTGDQGVFDEHGYLKIVGRKKEMIIRGGANIYPREIEEVLFQHPKVLDAAVVGLPDPRLGERTCACIVTREGETLTLDEIVHFLKGSIATYKLPERLELLDSLPRTPTGKVQKGPLRDMVEERRQE